MKPIIACVKVRMGSTRYPGKVMYEVAGKPLLGHLVSRIKRSRLIDNVIIATSVNKENNIIQEFCEKNDIFCFRGDENDVLGRTLKSLEEYGALTGVEVFGDCPLIDPQIIDFIVEKFIKNSDYDLVSNDISTTFPPGMEVEVYKVSALKKASINIVDPLIREHGTLYIRKNPKLFKIRNIEAPEKWRRPELELEIDTKEDIYVVSKIINYFFSKQNYHFDLDDIIQYLDKNSEIKSLNSKINRSWKKFRD